MATCVVILLAGTIVLAQQTETVNSLFAIAKSALTVDSKSTESVNKPAMPAADSAETEPVAEIQQNVLNSETPDHVFYDMFFNLVKSFDQASERRGSNGGNARMWRDHIQNRIGFDDGQMAVVRRVTDEFFTAIRPVHNQAMQIIADRRAANSGSQTPPEPSLELKALQEQREAIALTFGTRLRASLGNEALEQIRQSLQQSYGIPQEISDEDRQMFSQRLRQFRNGQRTSTETQEGGNSNE